MLVGIHGAALIWRLLMKLVVDWRSVITVLVARRLDVI